MNFSEWLDSLVDPLYEANGIPQCPPGYVFDKKTLQCAPKTKKDDVSGERDQKKSMSPDNMPSFNTIGSHGQNGAPYAYEENIAPNPWGYEPGGKPWVPKADQQAAHDEYYGIYEMEHNYDKEDEEEKEFKEKDKRMKYGKVGKRSSLRPGEVRKPNSRGGYDSNLK